MTQLPMRPVAQYYRNHRNLTDALARFAVGDRARIKETGHLGTVENLFGPGPQFRKFTVRCDNGITQVLSDSDLDCLPEHLIAQAVAQRFSLPPEVVANVFNETPQQMADRDRYLATVNGEEPDTNYPRHLRYAVRIQHWHPGPKQAYLDYIDLVDPMDVIPSEPEDQIRRHPTFQRYVAWYRAGHLPPYPSVFEQVHDGVRKLIGANRRRILTAREAGIRELPVWLGRWNRETGLPLKYGDILAAANQATTLKEAA
ncbi:MAG: hypothetical protein LC131_07090 [Anaerolineae bacterium]|nr:hypothetical protein [Anaerolineae bacterium]GIK44858.1 MAG: hypothetical protein BroJett012_07610 [Betaproteobacteria bacterium]